MWYPDGMQQATMLSVDEYLSTTYRPDREYLDGVLLERNVGEHAHSRTQMLLGNYLCNREKQWGIHVVPEQRVQVRSTRFRVPDVCVVLGEPQEQIFTKPPFICFEILSKDDTLEDMQDRVSDYLAFGVPYVWVLSPRTRRAWRFTPDGMYEVKDGVLRTENPQIAIPLAEVFG